MSQGNVETVRRAVEAFNELGFDGIGTSDLVTEDFEFHEPPEQPAPRVARGRKEVQELAAEFDAAWEEHQSEPQEIRAVDADRVLLVSVERFKGRDGIELKAPFAAIFTMREGKIFRWQAFWDKQKALDAAGTPELQN
jgi:ketosteroid isomerase-like protein